MRTFRFTIPVAFNDLYAIHPIDPTATSAEGCTPERSRRPKARTDRSRLVKPPPPPGQQATAERHAALTPLLERVFPIAQCDFTVADAQNYGRPQPTAPSYGSWSRIA